MSDRESCAAESVVLLWSFLLLGARLQWRAGAFDVEGELLSTVGAFIDSGAVFEIALHGMLGSVHLMGMAAVDFIPVVRLTGAYLTFVI